MCYFLCDVTVYDYQIVSQIKYSDIALSITLLSLIICQWEGGIVYLSTFYFKILHDKTNDLCFESAILL